MKIKPTHVAVNKRSGEKVKVEYDENTDKYKENSCVCLSNPDELWVLTEITKTLSDQ